MRWIATVMVLGVQAAALPPPFPREGATKMLDNDRVQVWDVAWLRRQYPLHRHVYDLAVVYYSPGDRIIISTTGERRPVSTPAWDITFRRRGLTHIEEGTSDPPLRAVFLEMKDEPRPDVLDTDGTPPFPAGIGKQLFQPVVQQLLRPLQGGLGSKELGAQPLIDQRQQLYLQRPHGPGEGPDQLQRRPRVA